MDLTPGTSYKVQYPFVLTSHTKADFDDPEPSGWKVPSWKPGTEHRFVYPDDDEMVYHGHGFMVLTVVDTFKPGKYPARVFYTRSWIDPQGHTFGKTKLRVTTVGHFRTLASGYRLQEYTRKGGIREAAESLAKELNITADELLARMGVAC